MRRIPDGVTIDGGSVLIDGQHYPLKPGRINVSTAGNHEAVAAVEGKQIRVIQSLLLTGADNTVRFESGAGGTDLTGDMPVPKGGWVLSPNAYGWFETAKGEALNLYTSAATPTAGPFKYIEV